MLQNNVHDIVIIISPDNLMEIRNRLHCAPRAGALVCLN